MARSCLPGILAAMHAHGGEPEVVGKALIMLGVLGQVGRAARTAWAPPRPRPLRPRARPRRQSPLAQARQRPPAPNPQPPPQPGTPPCPLLLQGEEEAHEVIRQTIIERTPFPAICAAVLRDLGTTK